MIDLIQLKDSVKNCTACGLHLFRTNIVFGIGRTSNPLVAFIGEAPGEQEDRQGEPFVGKAGKILDKWINWMGLKKEQVYILNPVLCRPPKNRPPTDQELSACRKVFLEQLDYIKPITIVALGKTAAKAILGDKISNLPMGDLRYKWYNTKWGQVRVTYHPAYIARNPAANNQAIEDLRSVREKIDIFLKSVDELK